MPSLPPQPYLQVAAWQQAIDLIASDPDLFNEASLTSIWLAAMNVQMLPRFDREYGEFKTLLGMAPKGEAQETDQVEIDLVSAKLESERGHADTARKNCGSTQQNQGNRRYQHC